MSAPEKKQTAVEWLEKAIDQILDGSGPFNFSEAFQKALAMEREQIEKAYYDGKEDMFKQEPKRMGYYYTETYGK